jgi:serine phosphatase RsbU (regulator of sigma subunit)
MSPAGPGVTSAPEGDGGSARAARAIRAQLHQEFRAPATAIVGYAEMLMDDGRRLALADLLPDLERIHAAGAALNALLQAVLSSQTDMAGIDAGKLRHDLRTPLNAIKGYGEMLIEDAAQSGGDALVPDLERLLAAATDMLARIEALIGFAGERRAAASDSAAAAGAALPAMREASLPEAAVCGRILVVDDNAANRDLLQRQLAREGHSVVHADSGGAALAFLADEQVDLVLLDLMMPDISGYEVLTTLKAQPATRDIPVIMISALDEIDSIVRCVEAGAVDYLPKPFDRTLLRARITASLENKRLRDQLQLSLERLQRELDAARSLQLGMLPRAFPPCTAERPVDVHALMDPAREVGGDLYDCFDAAEDMFCFMVGDVSGKGAPAAMFMARTSGLVRLAVHGWGDPRQPTPSPESVLQAVNRQLCENNVERMFVTLFLAFLDIRSGALTYVNAGHPPPYLLRATGSVETIASKPQRPLGVRRDTVYRSGSFTLQPGDAVVLYTDGVSEAIDAHGDFYTAERLDADLRTLGANPAETIVHAVKERVDAFLGAAPKTDDVTLLALRWRPPPADQ